MYAVRTCFNIDEVYVTPPLFHETITYLPIPTEIIFPGVKAETLVSVGTDSIMRLVSTKPLIHRSAFPLAHQLSSKFSLLSFSSTCHVVYRSFLISFARWWITCGSSDSAARIIDQMSAK